MKNSPIVYFYDRETGELCGAQPARESPLEPGVFLVPAFATLTPPPALKKGFARCFRDGAWVYVEDHRSQQLYRTTNGEPCKIDCPGPIPDGMTETPKPGEFYVWQDGQWVEDPVAKAADEKARAEASLFSPDTLKALLSVIARKFPDAPEVAAVIAPVLESANSKG